MVIGEAPGANEEVMGVPFVGQSGDELDRMLVEAEFLPKGLTNIALRKERNATIFLTNVCKYRPPENKIEMFFLDKKRIKPNELIKEGIAELHKEISDVRPDLIIATGDTPLWALTGKHGITKWRGSMLEHAYQDSTGTLRRALLMPTYHPALILREWSWRSIALHDLRRASRALREGHWPVRERRFQVRPSFEQVRQAFLSLLKRADEASAEAPLILASDLETRAGYIACHGLAWNPSDAICIPNMCVERPTGYFTLQEDVAILQLEQRLLTHPNVQVVGQNYLYDAQYKARRRGYIPNLRHDTLFMQQVAWPGLPKGLDFLSSMYRKHHVYWKDEGKEWNPSMPEEQLWGYNCEDGVATYESYEALRATLINLGLWEQYEWKMYLWEPALRMMLRGVNINQKLRNQMASEFMSTMQQLQGEINRIVGYEINLNSPKQVMHLFYEQFRFAKVFHKKTKRPTCDDEALQVFEHREPLIKGLTTRIRDLRSIGVVFSNVIMSALDQDGRMRFSFNPAAAESLRWNSGKNAWGGGTNGQNWTKGQEDEDEALVENFKMPNTRRLIIPTPEHDIASNDLTGADAQTVAWEADDGDLKRVFRENKVKIHAYNAKSMFGSKAPTGYEQPYYDLARTGVHLVNYVGGIDTLSRKMRISHAEAKSFMDYWFSLHPGILEWHERIQHQLETTRTVRNKFGYRRFYFDRIEGILPEAVAWIGQSTTACVTDRAIINLECSKVIVAYPKARRHFRAEQIEASRELLEGLGFRLLMQVHDEIVYEYPTRYRKEVLSLVRPLIHITVPYDDPLIIPWGLKLSTSSWGECDKYAWPE